MTMPRVSVVMATRNAARYVTQAIDSVCGQTVQDVEVIVVDGGSTDGTPDLARAYAGTRVIQETGQGFASAWNDGIAKARGEYVAILDSDDWWPADKLECQLQALAEHPSADGVIGHVRYFLEPGATVPFGFRPELLHGSHVAYMPSALLGRRRLFSTVGAFDTSWAIASDIDWFARLKDLGCPLMVLPQVVVHKRVHATNLSYTAAQGRVVRDEVLQLLHQSVRRQRRQHGGPSGDRGADS